MRVCIVGVGRHVEAKYLPWLVRRPDLRLAAVCDLPSQRSRLAKLLPGVPFFDDIEELLGAVKPDAVIISTPHDLHYAQARACLHHGVDTFIDKPLATSVEDAEDLVATSRQLNRLLVTAVPRRHSRWNALILQQIASGAVGEVYRLGLEYQRSRTAEYDSSWRNCPGRGGGVLEDAGYHVVDLLLRFCSIPLAAVTAQFDTQNANIDVEAFVEARMANGVKADTTLSLCGPRGVVNERITVTGTEGAILYHRTKTPHKEGTELRLVRSGQVTLLGCREHQNLDQRPLMHFMQLRAAGQSDCANLETDLRVVGFIAAAYAAGSNRETTASARIRRLPTAGKERYAVGMHNSR